MYAYFWLHKSYTILNSLISIPSHQDFISTFAQLTSLRQGFPEGETGRQFLQRILQGLRQAAKLGEVQWWIFWKVHPQNRWITVTGVVSPL